MSREYYIFSEKDEAAAGRVVQSIADKISQPAETFDGIPSDLGEILDIRNTLSKFRKSLVDDLTLCENLHINIELLCFKYPAIGFEPVAGYKKS